MMLLLLAIGVLQMGPTPTIAAAAAGELLLIGCCLGRLLLGLLLLRTLLLLLLLREAQFVCYVCRSINGWRHTSTADITDETFSGGLLGRNGEKRRL